MTELDPKVLEAIERLGRMEPTLTKTVQMSAEAFSKLQPPTRRLLSPSDLRSSTRRVFGESREEDERRQTFVRVLEERRAIGAIPAIRRDVADALQLLKEERRKTRLWQVVSLGLAVLAIAEPFILHYLQ